MSSTTVHEVMSYEEFYGLDSKILEATEWVNDHEDDRICEMVNRVLVIMQMFYNEHKYDTPQEWMNLQGEIRELNHELYTELQKIFMDYTDELEQEQDDKWFIPYDYNLEIDLAFDDILSAGVNGVTDRLYDDILSKATYYAIMPITTGVFSIYSNFRRAIKELTNLVDYNAQNGNKLIERFYLEFVYGTDALFDWVTSGVNTCEWCYYIESLNPQPLSALPIDHINGGCRIVPHNPTDYSEDYSRVRGWL